jgi:3',5'-cyclic AMP phosphodiesterase CpdA
MRTLAHISDVHFGRIDWPVLEGLLADLNERKPSVLVLSGDLTQRARGCQYRQAAEFLTRLPTPQIVVPGNHDIPLYDVARRFFLPLQKYRKYITADLRPSYQDEEIAILGINTARPFTFSLHGFWKDGEVSAEQLVDIRTRAKDWPKELFKIVVTHHPFIPPPDAARVEIVHGAKQALVTMEQCGIDMLLAGHLHMGYHGDVRTHHEATKRSILSVQAGTATSTRRRGKPNAYNWITIDRDLVIIEVRAWAGSAFAPVTTTRFNRVGGVWVQQA